ncbi:NAD-dependent DNA ligase LigA [Candidatus Schneideria nysicola]|uniref:NAD-dependent DNA ligase LigA n=1 Tax=Candidatus Schneideria nysicola TaxID=1081631 RepID=UPI001CAA4367|nr:NAD-dependent DNA ligase LigA [Candidatus Schneideria nysicola]UAJ65714.1 NAD-dependent DNA ligase LigA [Candidatus Schneideria nysicola]
MDDIKSYINNLRKKLHHWAFLYYVKNNPEVSDMEFDEAMEELRLLEEKRPDLLTIDSPTQTIGTSFKKYFKKVHHLTPMLSLNSIFNELELIDFDKKINNLFNTDKILYCCELKFDGIAINLIYKNGSLIQAATRGNGLIGEDITDNVRMVKSIPKYLNTDNIPDMLEIRGEVLMLNNKFTELNQINFQEGKRLFSNPRNAAAGSIRSINSDIISKKYLAFFSYGVGSLESRTISFNSHWQCLQQLILWGIPVHNFRYLSNNIKDILDIYYKACKIRSNLNFNIDGMVIKVDQLKLQKKLGSTIRAPRWAIAYKFQSKEKITDLYDVKFQVGRTGIITPIACFKKIEISGAKIKNASLYNFNEIERLGLMLGDTIIVQRIGDVIPRVISVVLYKRRLNKVKKIILPTHCPLCNSVIEISKNKIAKCTGGIICIAQKKESIKHFVSYQGMNIQGIGSKIIDKLVDNNLIHFPSDLFKLNHKILCQIDNIGPILSRKIILSIEKSKSTTLDKFLYALGIREVGLTTARNLAKTYGTLENIINADLDSLNNVKDVGEKTAVYIYKFFKNESNIRFIEECLHSSIGIQIHAPL